jgi:hypothetical protein
VIERVAEIERAVLPAEVFDVRLEGFGARAVVG